MDNKKTIIYHFIRHHWGEVLVTFCFTLSASIFSLLLPIVLAASYEKVFSFQSLRAGLVFDWLLIDSNSRSLAFYSYLFLALLILKWITDFGQRFWIVRLGELHVKEVRERLFAHQLQISMNIYDEKGIGRYLLRYSGDLTSIQNYISKGIIRFISDVFLITITIIFILSLNNQLGIVLIIALGGLGLCFLYLNRLLYRASEKRRNAKSGLLAFVNSRLQAILTIKSFNRANPECKRFNKKSQKIYLYNLGYHRINAFMGSLTPMVIYGTIIAILLIGSSQADATTLLIIVLLLISLQNIFRRLFRVNPIWKKGEISYQKLARILNYPSDNELQKKKFIFKKGEIELRKLHFGYTEENLLFHNVSKSIPPGKLTAIVGHSGCGKTTLAKLMANVYPLKSGSILIDQQPLEQLDNKSLRRKIAIIGEDWKLLGRTVFEAVSYSRRVSARPKAEEMIQKVQPIFPSLSSLHLDSKIGEAGNRLSSSQRQALLLIRALLTNKPILILDEPFAGLSRDNIQAYCDFLNQNHQNKTIILLTNILPDTLVLIKK